MNNKLKPHTVYRQAKCLQCGNNGKDSTHFWCTESELPKLQAAYSATRYAQDCVRCKDNSERDRRENRYQQEYFRYM